MREENKVILCPGHNYVHETSLHRTKELLDSGKIGKLVAIYIHYHIHHPEEVARRYPGVIRHILTHHSYILLYLAGKEHCPESVSAMKSVVHYDSFRGEDLALINLRLKSGALAHFCADFAADDHSGDPWTFSVKVIGTEGARHDLAIGTGWSTNPTSSTLTPFLLMNGTSGKRFAISWKSAFKEELSPFPPSMTPSSPKRSSKAVKHPSPRNGKSKFSASSSGVI